MQSNYAEVRLHHAPETRKGTTVDVFEKATVAVDGAKSADCSFRVKPGGCGSPSDTLRHPYVASFAAPVSVKLAELQPAHATSPSGSS